MATKTDTERASFEAWALEYNSDLTEWPNVLFVKNGSGKYAIIRVQDAWEAWQAVPAIARRCKGCEMLCRK